MRRKRYEYKNKYNNGEENSSGRKSDSSTISQFLRLVSNGLKNI